MTTDAHSPRRTARRRQLAALQAVSDETRQLFHRLKAVAEAVHRQGETSAGRRGILLDLATRGAQTVPQLARARPVSRQHIQMLVNGLLADGCVERIDNPAHARSHLVQLTAQGRALVGSMSQTESELLSQLPIATTAPDLETAARVLREVRALFEGPHWLRLIRDRGGERRRPRAGKPQRKGNKGRHP